METLGKELGEIKEAKTQNYNTETLKSNHKDNTMTWISHCQKQRGRDK